MMGVGAVAAACVLGQVSLRAGDPLGAELAEASIGGVTAQGIVLAGDGEATVGWQRVKGATGAWADDVSGSLGIATDLWRAGARLERGDHVSAEPLVLRHAERFAGQTGPSSSFVAETLVRCARGRGAMVEATQAWLGWVSASGSLESAYPELERLVDDSLGLAPEFPPVFLDMSELRAIGRLVAPEGESNRGAALTRLYSEAARFEFERATRVVTEASDDPGVMLVADIVGARIGDEVTRTASRHRLRERALAHEGTWVEAWARAGVGRSLALEDDVELRMAGVLEMLHVPSRFGDELPYLAGLCLAESSRVLAEEGSSISRAEARALASELARRYPRHPALSWHGVRGLLGDVALME